MVRAQRYITPLRKGARLLPLAARWECDLRTDRLTWTSGVYDLFGIERHAIVERERILELYEPEARRVLETLRDRAIKECGSFTRDFAIRTLAGERRIMRLTADVDIRNGRAVRLYGLKQDITNACGEACGTVPAW